MITLIEFVLLFGKRGIKILTLNDELDLFQIVYSSEFAVYMTDTR